MPGRHRLTPVLLLASAATLVIVVTHGLAGPRPIARGELPGQSAAGGDSQAGQGPISQAADARLAQDLATQSGPVTLSGDGFAPGETIVVQAVLQPDQPPVEVAVLAASQDGDLPEQTITLPEAVTSGQRTLRFIGQESGRTGEATIWVRAARRWIQLHSETLSPTDKVGFVAGGFEPEETVRVAFGRDGAETSFEVATDRAGNTAWTEFALPSYQPGQYRLVLAGERSGEPVTREVTVEPLKPTIELSPWYAPPGGRLDINARGFLPGETVSVSYESEEVGQTEADEYGNIWGARAPNIPYQAAQAMSVELRGMTSGATASAEVKIAQPAPWMELSSYAGAPGTAVYVSGGGWAAQERVNLYLDTGAGADQQAAGTGVTNEQGYLQYAGPALIPATDGETVEVIAVGEQSGAEATATFTVIRPYMPGLDELGQPPPRRQPGSLAPRATPTALPTPSPR